MEQNQNPPPASNLYTTIRGQVEHLNNILSQRIIWLVIAQSFFFSGFAVLITGKPDQKWAAIHEKLLVVFPVASMLAVILTYVDVISSLLYLRRLRNFYASKPKNDPNESNYPPMAGYKGLSMMEHVCPAVLPIVFTATWIYILYLQLAS